MSEEINKNEKKKGFFMKHLFDFVLLISLALGTASIYVIRAINESKDDGNALIATIYMDKTKMVINDEDGKNVNPFNLSLVKEEKRYNVVGKKGNLVISVKPNAISVIEAECPGQECVHEGWVSHSGHPIICAYNAVFIEITSSSWGDVIVIG